MKYDIKAQIFALTFTKLLKEYYHSHDLGVDIDPYLKQIKKEYKEIVLRTPGLEKGNFMQDNLTGASFFFAMAKIIPNMTPELMNNIVDDVMGGEFMMNLHKKAREKGLLFSDKEQDKFVNGAVVSQNSQYEMDWKYTYKKCPDEFFLTYTQCGVCKLAEREGVLDYLPCMCHMDFAKFKMKGGKLERDKTLAKGDDCCNFHVTRIK